MNNQELIKKAASVVKSKKTKGGLLGDVGCALVSEKNDVYLGVCASLGSNTFCAEQNAIGSMITKKDFKIKKIVSVWKDKRGKTFVIPPCGNCRQLMKEVNKENLNFTEVVLDKNRTVKLKDLLPYSKLWQRVD